MTVSVIKLGGSLQYSDSLVKWLDFLAEGGGGKVVIVPGGGKFADQVRRAQAHWRFDDEVAHQMAVLAMRQYGLMLTGLNRRLCSAETPKSIKAMVDLGQIPVWLPDLSVLYKSEISASWDTTSDSLAAWLSNELNADQLVLVKSVVIDSDQISADELINAEIVDRGFCHFIRDAGFTIRIYSASQYDLIFQGLAGQTDAGVLVSH